HLFLALPPPPPPPTPLPYTTLFRSVTLIIAQRLARRLHDCKKPIELPPKVLLDAGFSQADIDAGLTIYEAVGCDGCNDGYKGRVDRKSTRLNSSHVKISYAVFCLKK